MASRLPNVDQMLQRASQARLSELLNIVVQGIKAIDDEFGGSMGPDGQGWEVLLNRMFPGASGSGSLPSLANSAGPATSSTSMLPTTGSTPVLPSSSASSTPNNQASLATAQQQRSNLPPTRPSVNGEPAISASASPQALTREQRSEEWKVIVHYMDARSKMTPDKLAHAHAAFHRWFGWAPSKEQMQRAREAARSSQAITGVLGPWTSPFATEIWLKAARDEAIAKIKELKKTDWGRADKLAAFVGVTLKQEDKPKAKGKEVVMTQAAGGSSSSGREMSLIAKLKVNVDAVLRASGQPEGAANELQEGNAPQAQQRGKELSFNASAQEIQDEIALLQVLINALDPHSDTYLEDKAAEEKAMASLQDRLDAFPLVQRQGPAVPASGAEAQQTQVGPPISQQQGPAIPASRAETQQMQAAPLASQQLVAANDINGYISHMLPDGFGHGVQAVVPATVANSEIDPNWTVFPHPMAMDPGLDSFPEDMMKPAPFMQPMPTNPIQMPAGPSRRDSVQWAVERAASLGRSIIPFGQGQADVPTQSSQDMPARLVEGSEDSIDVEQEADKHVDEDDDAGPSAQLHNEMLMHSPSRALQAEDSAKIKQEDVQEDVQEEQISTPSSHVQQQPVAVAKRQSAKKPATVAPTPSKPKSASQKGKAREWPVIDPSVDAPTPLALKKLAQKGKSSKPFVPQYNYAADVTPDPLANALVAFIMASWRRKYKQNFPTDAEAMQQLGTHATAAIPALIEDSQANETTRGLFRWGDRNLTWDLPLKQVSSFAKARAQQKKVAEAAGNQQQCGAKSDTAGTGGAAAHAETGDASTDAAQQQPPAAPPPSPPPAFSASTPAAAAASSSSSTLVTMPKKPKYGPYPDSSLVAISTLTPDARANAFAAHLAQRFWKSHGVDLMTVDDANADADADEDAGMGASAGAIVDMPAARRRLMLHATRNEHRLRGMRELQAYELNFYDDMDLQWKMTGFQLDRLAEEWAVRFPVEDDSDGGGGGGGEDEQDDDDDDDDDGGEVDGADVDGDVQMGGEADGEHRAVGRASSSPAVAGESVDDDVGEAAEMEVQRRAASSDDMPASSGVRRRGGASSSAGNSKKRSRSEPAYHSHTAEDTVSTAAAADSARHRSLSFYSSVHDADTVAVAEDDAAVADEHDQPPPAKKQRLASTGPRLDASADSTPAADSDTILPSGSGARASSVVRDDNNNNNNNNNDDDEGENGGDADNAAAAEGRQTEDDYQHAPLPPLPPLPSSPSSSSAAPLGLFPEDEWDEFIEAGEL